MKVNKEELGTLSGITAAMCSLILNLYGCRDYAIQNGWNDKREEMMVQYKKLLGGGIYLLLPEQFVNRRSFAVRKVPSKNGQTKGCNLSQDFIISEKRIAEVFAL